MSNKIYVLIGEVFQWKRWIVCASFNYEEINMLREKLIVKQEELFGRAESNKTIKVKGNFIACKHNFIESPDDRQRILSGMKGLDKNYQLREEHYYYTGSCGYGIEEVDIYVGDSSEFPSFCVGAY
jgi:hypothetical protein